MAPLPVRLLLLPITVFLVVLLVSMAFNQSQDLLILLSAIVGIIFINFLAFGASTERSIARVGLQIIIYSMGTVLIGATLFQNLGIMSTSVYWSPAVLQYVMPIAMCFGVLIAWACWAFDKAEYRAYSNEGYRYETAQQTRQLPKPKISVMVGPKHQSGLGLKLGIGFVAFLLSPLYGLRRVGFVVKTGVYRSSLWVSYLFASTKDSRSAITARLEQHLKGDHHDVENRWIQFWLLITVMMSLVPFAIGLSVMKHIPLTVGLYSFIGVFAAFALVNIILCLSSKAGHDIQSEQPLQALEVCYYWINTLKDRPSYEKNKVDALQTDFGQNEVLKA